MVYFLRFCTKYDTRFSKYHIGLIVALSLTNATKLDSKLKTFADMFSVIKMIKIVLENKHCGKRRQCWTPVLSPFSIHVFLSLPDLKVVKILDFLVEEHKRKPNHICNILLLPKAKNYFLWPRDTSG